MRCEQVIRELAVPSDDRDAAALASHIASCPACATWADRAVQLDRLWQATRPSEPTSDVWDSVWTNLAASLDSSAPSQIPVLSSRTDRSKGSRKILGFPVSERRGPSSGSRPWVLITIGLAQAAAIFLAVNLTWSRFNPLHNPHARCQ